MVVAMSVAVPVPPVDISKSEIERNRRADVGRISIAVAWVIVGIIGRRIGRPINSTSAETAGNQQAGSDTPYCTSTWSVHLNFPERESAFILVRYAGFST